MLPEAPPKPGPGRGAPFVPALTMSIYDSPISRLAEYLTWKGSPMKRVAEAGAPGRVSFEITTLVVSVREPRTVPSLVTLMLNVQLACGGSETPLTMMKLV